ncbi:O-antigen ligase family protein [Methylobacterium radiodurans]|uniref:Polymerase n=1 Tax=Methylobacterium radiodurans TaxID=2202828 RepID=A0A2U8W0H1_9HYPH|nr:O-antigen ligase family protein [Methylobacterium radiodurans]AWN38952.1 polymerase [Methylobacterium radiodurans]
MALANRSSPALVAVAALLVLAGRLAEDAAGTLRDLVGALVAPLGLAVLALLAWTLASFAWTPFPAVSLRALSEFAPTLLAAFLLARLAPGRIPAFAGPLACAALALAAAIIVASLATDLRLQAWLGQRDAAFVFNRPAMTLVLLGAPVALVLWRQGRPWLGAAALAFASVGALRSISGAAAMGLGAGFAMAALAAILPRRVAVGIAGLGLGLAVALAPVEGDLLERLMPEAAHARLVQSSSRARVAIARSFGAAVAADPWRGAGFGVAPGFAETPAAARIEPDLRPMLAVGHPHNTFLQVWAELGLVGAVLLALALFLALRPVAALARPAAAAALGLAAAAAAIAFVEHNAWAAWWTASLGAAITWLREATKPGNGPA